MDTKTLVEEISRGTTEIISVENLAKKLADSHKNKKSLCVKAGFDPTAPDIHLGHVVLLRKLRQFQDFGHRVSFLIGDFTAQVGDPTGRVQTRPKLDKAEIARNANTYQEQVFKVLDPKKTDVVFNSVWLDKLSAQEILALTAHSTVAQMLARADFKKRFEGQSEISILEFIYPILQGYDSIHLKADIEIGGSDQKFNLLMGRQLQEDFGQDPQVVIMTPLLEGTDGVQKMSKSLGNYIGISEAPGEILGKVMSISDELMRRYYEILTDFDLREVAALHPKEAKMRLGYEIVRQFHGEKNALAAREYFENVFSRRQHPDQMDEYVLGKRMETFFDVLMDVGMVTSRRDFQRLLQQGALSHDGEVIHDAKWTPRKGVIKIGKRRFIRFV